MESRATSASSAVRGGLPASLNQAMRRWSPSSAQVPRTTPPATTIGEIQPLCLLTAARRAAGTTWTSSVPRPSTYWSKPGSSRTAAVGLADASSSSCSARTYARSPSTFTSASRSPRAPNHVRIRRALTLPRDSQLRKFSIVAGPYAPKYATITIGAATSGSGTPAQRELAASGRVKVTRLPRLAPKQRSPCHASGFRSVPQPERSASPTCPSPRLAMTAATSSSRVRMEPSRASRTVWRRTSHSFGVIPK